MKEQDSEAKSPDMLPFMFPVFPDLLEKKETADEEEKSRSAVFMIQIQMVCIIPE